MALKHFWYSLRDDEGIPISGQQVYIYKHGTTDELDIFNSIETQISQPLITTSTSPSGIFDFYIKDIHSSGYLASQKMTIDWSLGSVDNLDIFDKIYPVNETDTDSDKDKSTSNQLAYNLEIHKELLVDGGTTIHNLLPVDETDSNVDFNKIVSNNLMNNLYSGLASAGTITISSSGAIISSFSIDVKDGVVPAWLDSLVPSAGDYYVDINHGLDIKYPLISIWKTSNKKTIFPPNIMSIDEYNIRIWSNENMKSEISIVG